MLYTTMVFTGLHFFATIVINFRNSTKIDKELVIQHHEKCVMFGLIAIAVYMR